MIAEEVAWRSRRWLSHGWAGLISTPEWLRHPSRRRTGTSDLEAAETLPPGNIAELYRQLRKGREDAKDTPGAADFYYGEMEMRRHAAPRLSGERLVLSSYWMLSGYGLRASRAFFWLAVVLTLAAYAMAGIGFCDPAKPFAEPDGGGTCAAEGRGFADVRFEDVLRLDVAAFTVGTAVAVVGAPAVDLTSEGEAIRVAIRVIAPLLIALALLAIRARVKR